MYLVSGESIRTKKKTTTTTTTQNNDKKTNFKSHSHRRGILWKDEPDEYKEWYVNNICARDIMKYDLKTGPGGSHWGPAVNVKVAEYFMDNLSNE